MNTEQKKAELTARYLAEMNSLEQEEKKPKFEFLSKGFASTSTGKFFSTEALIGRASISATRALAEERFEKYTNPTNKIHAYVEWWMDVNGSDWVADWDNPNQCKYYIYFDHDCDCDIYAYGYNVINRTLGIRYMPEECAKDLIEAIKNNEVIL